MQDEMNVSIAVNERYMRYACVMLTSLFENHKAIKVCVYVLYSDMTEKSLQELKALGERYGQNVLAVHMNPDSFPEQLPRSREWTVEIYYRLALGDVLPREVKRVLYLDVDIAVIGSVRDFYSTDFQGKSLCACPDMSAAGGLSAEQRQLFGGLADRPDFRYFNSGVLLLNLEKLRQNFDLERFCALALELPLVSPDQDLLNYLFWDDVILREAEKFDLFARLAYRMGHGYEWVKEHTAIVHYAGFKPWAYDALHFDTERFWWEYAAKTPFYTELLEELVLKEMDACFMDRLVGRMEKEKRELVDALGKCMETMKKLHFPDIS